MPTEVRIVSPSSNVRHRGFVEDGVLFTAEGDNIDSTSEHTIYHPNNQGRFSLPAGSERCRRCFSNCTAIDGANGKQCILASGHAGTAHPTEEPDRGVVRETPAPDVNA